MRGSTNMETCPEHNKLADKIDAVHTDLKVLIAGFTAMNGSLKEVKAKTDNHIDTESPKYRKKVDELWAGIAFSKWIIILLFGSGVFWAIAERLVRR